MGKTIATATAYLHFSNGRDDMQSFELVKTDASTYGNGMTVVRSGEGWSEPMLYDVRYDTSIRRDGSNFPDWVVGFLNGLTFRPAVSDIIVI